MKLCTYQTLSDLVQIGLPWQNDADTGSEAKTLVLRFF
jgi:hypothetical protein